MTPNRGLTKETPLGIKGVKNRLTYSMCGNANGSDILPPFVIGKLAKPQAFNKKTGAQLGFRYFLKSGYKSGTRSCNMIIDMFSYKSTNFLAIPFLILSPTFVLNYSHPT